MIKMIAVIAALALIAGVSAHKTFFLPEYEYVYRYDTAVLTSLPDVAHQYAGMRLLADVYIQKQRQGRFIFMMKNITIGRVNEKLLTTDPEHIPWKYGNAKDMEQELERPIEVEFKDGRFISMDVNQDEKPQATNIKKAIVSNFQISIDPSDPAYRGSHRELGSRGNYLPKSGSDAFIYSTYEDGVNGDCDTIYVVDSTPSAYKPEADVFNITKIRSYDNCTKQPIWVRTNHLAYDCNDCNADDVHVLETVTVVRADIVRKDNSYLLEELESVSHTSFNPLTADGDNIVSNTSQVLCLKSVQPITRRLPSPSSVVPHKTLQYVFPDAKRYVPGPSSLKNRPPAHGIPYEGEPVPRAQKLLEEIAQKIHSDELANLEDATYYCTKLMFQMRNMDFEEIQAVFPLPEKRGYFNYENTPQWVKLNIFLQTLPMVGTGPSTMYIIELFASGRLQGEIGIQIMMGLGKYILEPTTHIIKELTDLAESPVVQTKPQLKSATWLTIASLVYQACTGSNDSPTRPLPPYLTSYCTHNDEDKYIHKFGEKLKESSEIADKLLFIRVIGRAGLPGGFEHLTDIVRGFKAEIDAVRKAAIFSMIPLARSGAHAKVMELLDRVFYSTSEPTSVRQAAIIVQWKAQPDYAALQRLAAWSWYEPEDQVSSLIYSHFAHIANSSHPCASSLSSVAKSLLPFVKEVDYGIQSGHYWEVSDYDDDYAFGAQLHGSYTGSNNSMIPDLGRMALNWTIGGYSTELFTMSYNSHNLKKVFDRVVGPSGAVTDVDRKTDIFDINNKLGIKPRNQEDWFLSIMYTIMNSKSRMIFISEKEVQRFLSELVPFLSPTDFKEGYPVDFVKHTTPLDLKYHMPSENGLPMMIRVATPIIMRASGRVKMAAESSEIIIPPFATSARITVEFKIMASMIVKGSVSIIDIFERKRLGAGVSFSTAVKAPISAEIKYRINEGNFRISLRPTLAQPVPPPNKLILYKIRPTTMEAMIFTDIVDPSSYKIVHSNPHPDEYEVDFRKKDLGLPFLLKVVSERDFTDLGSYLQDLEDKSWIQIASYFWLSPEFKCHSVKLHILEPPSDTRDIELVFNITYTPTYSEKMYLEENHKNNLTGLLGYARGWSRFPQKCKPSDSSSSYDRKDYDFRPKLSSGKDYDYSSKFDSKQDYDYSPKLQGRKDYETDKPTPYQVRSRPGYSDSSRVIVIPRRPEVRKWHLKFAIQSTHPSESKLLTDTYFERDYDKHKDKLTSTIFLKNAPYMNSDLQICVHGSTYYPEIPCDYIEQTKPCLNDPIQSSFSVKWGNVCPVSPQINGTIKLEKSKEQLDYQLNAKGWYMKQCKADIILGLQDSYACDKTRTEMTSYNKLKAEVSYKDLPGWLKNFTIAIGDYLEYKLYGHMTYNPIPEKVQEGTLKISAKVYNEIQAANLKLYTARGNVFFHKIFYGDALPYTYTISAKDALWKQFLNDITGHMAKPTCTISKKYVSQFDNNTIYYPLNECYHLVAKDCTRASLFSVLMANEKDYKVLKMDLVGRNITVKYTDGSFEARIDGTVYAFTPNDVIVVRGTAQGSEKIIAYMSKMGSKVHIQAPGLSMTVVYNGHQARVEMSNIWRGKVCGLCGEFSGDSDEAFVGPKQCTYADSISYGLSYAIPSARCTLPPPPNPDKICVKSEPYYQGRQYLPRFTARPTPGFNDEPHGFQDHLDKYPSGHLRQSGPGFLYPGK